jgi:hypothetical protein
MNSSDAIYEILHVHHPGLSTGPYETYVRAATECAYLARECLERRKQPDIGAVLDEIITKLKELQYRSDGLLITYLYQLRSKYCPAPKEEKPKTQKEILSELIAAVKELDVRIGASGLLDLGKWMDKLQDQLKEVE